MQDATCNLIVCSQVMRQLGEQVAAIEAALDQLDLATAAAAATATLTATADQPPQAAAVARGAAAPQEAVAAAEGPGATAALPADVAEELSGLQIDNVHLKQRNAALQAEADERVSRADALLQRNL